MSLQAPKIDKFLRLWLRRVYREWIMRILFARRLCVPSMRMRRTFVPTMKCGTRKVIVLKCAENFSLGLVDDAQKYKINTDKILSA